MKKVVASTLILVMLALVYPAGLAAQQSTGGVIVGLVKDSRGLLAPNYTARLRNVTTGQVIKTFTTSPYGEFSFTEVDPGQYVVEIADAAGNVLGSTKQVTLAAGTTVGHLTVTLPTAAKNAVPMSTGVRRVDFFKDTAHIVVLAAAGAGVATVVYVATKSGSK